jgi:Flp pilus assembly protein TadB
MLSDRERQLLTDIEQQLRIEDPSLAHKFEGAASPVRAGHQRLIATALGVLALLAAFALLFGSPGMAVAFALIAGTIALLWYVLSSEMGCSNETSLGIGSRRYPDPWR